MRPLAFAAAVLGLTPGARAFADPRSSVDADWMIEAHGFRAQPLDAPGEAWALIDVRGMRDAGKGFTIRVVNRAVWEGYRSGLLTLKQMEASADSQKVTSLHARLKVEGPSAVVVENSENASKPMVVHVRITLHPVAR